MRRIVLVMLFAFGLGWSVSSVAQEAATANQRDALVDAARGGNRAVLRSLIADGISLDSQSVRDGQTALIAAIEEGQMGALHFLLEQGARVDASNRAGVVPLQAAVEVGNRAAILVLVQKRADVESRISTGETALLHAASHHKPGAVAALLLVGARLEATDGLGRTPLLAAVCTAPADAEASEHKAETIRILLNWNARLDAKALNDETVQSCAARNQPASVAEQLDAATVERAALAKAEEKAKIAKAGDAAAELRFNLLLKAFGRNQDDDFVRGLIFAAAEALPKPRPVPVEAQRVHDAAMIALKSADEHDQIERPIAELRRAVEMAPWWREAYRDLSLALDKNGQYEWASEQMELYLRSRPQGAGMEKELELMIQIELQADTWRRSLK